MLSFEYPSAMEIIVVSTTNKVPLKEKIINEQWVIIVNAFNVDYFM